MSNDNLPVISMGLAYARRREYNEIAMTVYLAQGYLTCVTAACPHYLSIAV